MSSWFKYLILLGVFMLAFVFVATITLRHESNVTATQEVNPTVESAKYGEARTTATNAIDKKALVANFIMKTVDSHKAIGEDIKIDYVFLDESGNNTTDEDAIDSIQFKVDVINSESGEILSTSKERISLNKYEP